jgi:hypothetical protein
MSSVSVFGLVASYVALAALLVSLNIASLWAWWVKALAIVVMTGFYAGSYLSVSGMLGWPALSAPPDHFQLISSTVVEPSKRTGDRGAIYLWVRRIDEEGNPFGAPRAFQIGFDDGLAREVAAAQREIEGGREMMGTLQESPLGKLEKTDKKRLGSHDDMYDAERADDTVPFQAQNETISFEPLPPATLPEKPPL